MEEDKDALITQYEIFQGQVSEKYIDYNFQHKNSIYHYTSAEGLMGIVASGTIRFTEYSSLNDATEGDYIFFVLKSLLNYDIAYDKRNPFPGQIFNQPNGKNVYDWVIIDYFGEDITRQNFIAAITGDAKSIKKKIKEPQEKY